MIPSRGLDGQFVFRFLTDFERRNGPERGVSLPARACFFWPKALGSGRLIDLGLGELFSPRAATGLRPKAFGEMEFGFPCRQRRLATAKKVLQKGDQGNVRRVGPSARGWIAAMLAPDGIM